MRLALKPLALAALILSSSMPILAQIKDYVPVVRPVYAKETVDFLLELSDSMKADGYTEAAKILKSYADGGFGSGFAYVAKDGANYVVTNRHVVSQADSVTLEFEKPDGSQSVFKDCKVIAVGEELDLALVALPSSSHPFTAGLVFDQAAVEDGEEVWSAGYPGLGSTPSWQLGKGNVTNASTKVPELVDPAVSTLIQHSAQVDPGNSGGPLLVVDKSSKSGYKVVGVNTWSAVGRQATNLSIPAAAIRSFIAQSLAGGKDDKGQAQALEARCRAFISGTAKAEDAYKEIAKYISYAYVAKDGKAILKKVLSIAPTAVRDDIVETFSDVSPIEGIRLAVAYRVASLIKSASAQSGLGFVAVDGNADAAGSSVPVRFTLAGKEISLSWLREHGVWRLESYPMELAKADDKDKGKAAGTSAITFDDSPYHVLFQLGADLPLGTDDSKYWHLDTIMVPSTYFGIGATVGGKTVAIPATTYSKASTSPLVRIGGLLRGQFPIRTDFASFIPYVGVDGGMQICMSTASDLSGIFSVVEAGLQVGIGGEPHLYLGCSYKYFPAPILMDSLMSDSASSSTAASGSSAVSLWLGLGF
jgi:serine protease Do